MATDITAGIILGAGGFKQTPSARKIPAKNYNAWRFSKMRKYARDLRKRICITLKNALLDIKNAVSYTTCVIALLFPRLTYMSTYKGKWKITPAKGCSKMCGIPAGGSGITGKVVCPDSETKICDSKTKPPQSAIQCAPTLDCGTHVQI